MATLSQLESRISAIEQRNAKVAADKAWETSGTRKIILILNTYIIIGFFMWWVGIPDPWLNAIVPSIGFFLSTLTLPAVKRWWLSSKK